MCPAMVTTPPMGTIANARNAGTSDRYGARKKILRSAVVGTDCSLKNSLMPSASVWSSPNGPARSGPMRFCMRAITLRRNQMYMRTESSTSTNTAIVLPITINTTVRSTPFEKSGSVMAMLVIVWSRRGAR